jgi:hypothetical protein
MRAGKNARLLPSPQRQEVAEEVGTPSSPWALGPSGSPARANSVNGIVADAPRVVARCLGVFPPRRLIACGGQEQGHLPEECAERRPAAPVRRQVIGVPISSASWDLRTPRTAV